MTLICVSSDWHADARSHGVDRFDDVAQAVAQTVKVAREEHADLYLFLGDLCDPDDGPRALRAVRLMLDVALELADAAIPLWAIAGNHCRIEDSSGRSVLSPLAAFEHSAFPAAARIFDGPATVMLPGKTKKTSGRPAFATLLPYPPASNPYDPAAFVRSAQPRESIVMVAGHMTELSGIEPGEESLEMSRGRGVPFPLAECEPSWLLLNGHWHHGQTFESGGRTVIIPGSLARLTHGEAKARPRFLLVEV